MPCPANIRETRIAVGYQHQSGGDVQTPNIAAEMVSFTKLNDTLAEITPVVETDADWIGKGDEFATQSFLSSWGVSVSVEKYLSSQFLAREAVFGLGHVAYSSGVYTCTPATPATDCIELLPFSYLETIRQGGSAVLDRVFVGMVTEEFQVTLGSGPGLNNSKLTATYVGTGKYISPSSIVQPALSSENILSGSSLACTINGTNYVSAKNMVSLTFGFKNNTRLDSGYFPGSGYQTASGAPSGQIRGRMEFGNRVINGSYVARFQNGSTELAQLLAQSTGTAVIGLTGATGHSMTATFQKDSFASAVVGNTDGIVSVAVTLAALTHPTNGLFTLAVGTNLVGIA